MHWTSHVAREPQSRETAATLRATKLGMASFVPDASVPSKVHVQVIWVAPTVIGWGRSSVWGGTSGMGWVGPRYGMYGTGGLFLTVGRAVLRPTFAGFGGEGEGLVTFGGGQGWGVLGVLT